MKYVGKLNLKTVNIIILLTDYQLVFSNQ